MRNGYHSKHEIEEENENVKWKYSAQTKVKNPKETWDELRTRSKRFHAK